MLAINLTVPSPRCMSDQIQVLSGRLLMIGVGASCGSEASWCFHFKGCYDRRVPEPDEPAQTYRDLTPTRRS